MTTSAFDSVSYMPILSLRPAEMNALSELPQRDKNLLLPLIEIGPWVGSHRLESSLLRIEEAFGARPIVADLTHDERTANRRPVHGELDELRDPTNGYDNWYQFILDRQNLIPVIQLSDTRNFRPQIRKMADLNREMVVRLPEAAISRGGDLARALLEFVEAHQVCIVLDFERQTREILLRQASALSAISQIFDVSSDFFIAISASSFPDTFVGLARQDIYERLFFNRIEEQIASHSRQLIYSDRGSARAERQSGGSGQPSPRVDYPSGHGWDFFREEADDDRPSAYAVAAQRAMRGPNWDGQLRIWGTQMIERTAADDTYAIGSAAKSTAVRINIHIHQQLHYGAGIGELRDTDDDWSD